MKAPVIEAVPVTVNRAQMFRLRYEDGSIRTELALTALAELRNSVQLAGLRLAHLWEDREKLQDRIKESIERGDSAAQLHACLATMDATLKQSRQLRQRIDELAAQVRATTRQPYAKAVREQLQAEMERVTAELPPLFNHTKENL